jgi:hypothetical protein
MQRMFLSNCGEVCLTQNQAHHSHTCLLAKDRIWAVLASGRLLECQSVVLLFHAISMRRSFQRAPTIRTLVEGTFRFPTPSDLHAGP